MPKNAVRYSPNSGRIEVIVAANEPAAPASLQVRDHGIGLYVVKEIVTLHGGTVDVASEADVGSTYTVNLPPQPIKRR